MRFWNKKDINDYVRETDENKEIVLLDVRSKEEYEEDHIPNSVNIPLEQISKITIQKDKTLFVYCYSGNRSTIAVEQLKKLGYKNVTNIGGISQWKK